MDEITGCQNLFKVLRTYLQILAMALRDNDTCNSGSDIGNLNEMTVSENLSFTYFTKCRKKAKF